MLVRVVVPAAAVALLAAGAWFVKPSREPERAPRRVMTRAEFARQMLFEELRPVKVAGCGLARLGEPHDGGYLMCAGLLPGAGAAYSYGIAGYDGWGCDVSRTASVTVHQYDCFDTRPPHCPGGRTQFHAECVAATPFEEEGRVFDTLARQIARNGDEGRRLVMKMDVEGAEWDALLDAPGELLDRIDQLAIEFHGVDEDKYVLALQKLKQHFHVAHLHFNNFGCDASLAPFPAWAYEVLFVNKRLGGIESPEPPALPSPLDASNNPDLPDCQATSASRRASR